MVRAPYDATCVDGSNTKLVERVKLIVRLKRPFALARIPRISARPRKPLLAAFLSLATNTGLTCNIRPGSFVVNHESFRGGELTELSTLLRSWRESAPKSPEMMGLSENEPASS